MRLESLRYSFFYKTFSKNVTLNLLSPWFIDFRSFRIRCCLCLPLSIVLLEMYIDVQEWMGGRPCVSKFLFHFEIWCCIYFFGCELLLPKTVPSWQVHISMKWLWSGTTFKLRLMNPFPAWFIIVIPLHKLELRKFVYWSNAFKN